MNFHLALQNCCLRGDIFCQIRCITFFVSFFIQDGCTALMLACEEGHVAVAEYLIAQGADVNAKNNVWYNMINDALFHTIWWIYMQHCRAYSWYNANSRKCWYIRSYLYLFLLIPADIMYNHVRKDVKVTDFEADLSHNLISNNICFYVTADWYDLWWLW